MTQQIPNFEIFDKLGHFAMPSAEQIASLDAETQERFRAVQEASRNLDAAKSNREAAEQAITDAIAERDDAERELKRVRPKITHTQLAKEFIASEQAKR